MSTVPAKVCVVCKQDCSQKPRLKDPQGRYTCQACADALEARARLKVRPVPLEAPAPAPVPAPLPDEPDLGYALAEEVKAAGSIAQDTASCMGCGVLMAPGALICTRCGYDTRTGAPMKTSKKAPRGPKRCEKCGYDLTGLKKPKCPECGTVFRMGRDLKKEREEDNRRTVRWAYYKPLIASAAGLLLMTIIAAARVGSEALPGVFIMYAGGYIVASAVYWTCSLLWFGFDAPLHLTLLRMIAVCAFADSAYWAVSGLPMFLLTRAIVLFVFVGAMTELMDLDFTDAVIVGLITGLGKLLALFAIIMYLSPNF
jgi:hypothetical protein